jgi:hypothetical protein
MFGLQPLARSVDLQEAPNGPARHRHRSRGWTAGGPPA